MLQICKSCTSETPGINDSASATSSGLQPCGDASMRMSVLSFKIGSVVKTTRTEKRYVQIGSRNHHSGLCQIRAEAMRTPMVCTRSPITWTVAARRFRFSRRMNMGQCWLKVTTGLIYAKLYSNEHVETCVASATSNKHYGSTQEKANLSTVNRTCDNATTFVPLLPYFSSLA